MLDMFGNGLKLTWRLISLAIAVAIVTRALERPNVAEVVARALKKMAASLSDLGERIERRSQGPHQPTHVSIRPPSESSSTSTTRKGPSREGGDQGAPTSSTSTTVAQSSGATEAELREEADKLRVKQLKAELDALGVRRP